MTEAASSSEAAATGAAPARRPFRRLGIAAVSVALAVVATAALVLTTTTTPARVVHVAPIAGRGLDGAPVVAPFGTATHPGRATVLVFFASWCTPCQQELPEIARFLARHSRPNVAVLGVDGETPSATARAFVARVGFEAPVLVDPPPFAVASGRFSLPGFPDTIVISATGRLLATHVGQVAPRGFAALYALA
jgi:thiol-disulfide isomerase/thioredoxin